jgi:hypothetical protein
MAKMPLRALKNTKFFSLYKNLLDGKILSKPEAQALLTAAVIFMNNEDNNIAAFGYRIVVLYSNLTGDYKPLYDVALSKGFMPIVRSAEKYLFSDLGGEHFFPQYFSALLDQYRDGDAVLTEQQVNLNSFFSEHDDTDVTVTAPTSYGKSELIASFCNRNITASICVIVPTKALLAQTKQRLLSLRKSDDRRKIVTHAEMLHIDDINIVVVLTQKRLLRFFIQRPNFNFDTVFVDEAHNLLGDDARSLLLAKVIVLQKSRNSNSKIKFLTPFLVEEGSLHLRYVGFETEDFKVMESLKTERYHIVDFRKDGILHHYDQFLDEFWQGDEDRALDGISFIRRHAAKKNIIFFNLPKKIEIFIRELLPTLEPVESEVVARVCESIAEFLHSDYLLVEGLRKGVLYHHGSVPDIVKLYAERAYSDVPEIQHIICNSTLLEGVNIPAERMFVMENKKGLKKLSQSQFRNLVGRICRFREIFHPDTGSLTMLEPNIYLVGTDKYLPSNANLEKFIKDNAQVDLKVVDRIDNVLLDESVLDDDEYIESKREADEFLEVVLPGTTGLDVARPQTATGRACLLNNISEIDILQFETEIHQEIASIKIPLQTSNEILETITRAFVPYLKPNYAYDVIRRIEEESAQKFYSMLIDWKIKNTSYAEMIANFLHYWENFGSDEVYVGKWGEIERGESHRKNWVKIGDKTYAEKVNLAIVRIKEEQDLVENSILKYVELLNDLGKISDGLYLDIKYGTRNHDKIMLINNGINSSLAGKLIDLYADCIDVSLSAGHTILLPVLIERMRENNENEIFVFEAGLHMGLTHEF